MDVGSSSSSVARACQGWRQPGDTNAPWFDRVGLHRLYESPVHGTIEGSDYFHARVQHLASNPNITWDAVSANHPEKATSCEAEAAKEQGYKEVDAAGKVPNGRRYQNPGCKAYELCSFNDGDRFCWTAQSQLISKVYLKKHPTLPRCYTLNAKDKKMVNDFWKARVRG